jgi:hypothetical protein
MTDRARVAIDALTALDPEARVEAALGALLASDPELVEAAAAALPDRIAATLAALLLAPQVRRQVGGAADGEVTH